MHYQEFAPIPELRTFVKCIWILQSGNQPSNDFERIFPDGHPELIFHFGPPFEKRTKETVYIQPACFVYGQLSIFIELRPSSNGNVLGIRFEPFGLAAFSLLPQFTMTDKEIDFDIVFPNQENVYQQLSEADIEGKVQHVQSFLQNALILNANPVRNEEIVSVQSAVDQMRKAETPFSSEELASFLCISVREMERRFREYIGLSPKQLAKTFRFQDVLQKKFLDKTLTQIALESGYYDQSHFIRDFKAFSGLAPAGFFKQEKGFTDLFINH